MTCSVTKLSDAGQAYSYYSEKDDYYLSDRSSAEWYGAGAGRLGLGGEIDPGDFRDVLTGHFRDVQVGTPDRHTPGWDVTMDAPKSVSIAALVNKDSRLIKAHDVAVRVALDHLEKHSIVTRQRAEGGDYAWRPTGSMVAGVVRHSTSRNLDPQLHSHCIVANVTRDPVTGKWVSIDTRAGLYTSQKEAGNVYMSELAKGVRAAGYEVEWRVAENGNATFEIASISQAEREMFSTRNREIRNALAARGLDKDTASGAAREAATLDTRREKQHMTAGELHAKWTGQAHDAGYSTGAHPKGRSKPEPAQRMRAARAAVAAGIAQLGERQTRFTRRQVIAEATKFAQGKASQQELSGAVVDAHEAGTLIDRGTLVRGFSKELETTAGFTTKSAMETEAEMLRRAANIADRAPSLSLSGEDVSRLIRDREMESGHPFTDEQRAATTAVLEGRGGLAVVQGYAGTAKTTSVLSTIAEVARDQNVRVRAIAPTHSAADTLGAAIGSESTTVAALNGKPLERDGRAEIWIVDEAGMVSAGDMKRLLERADQVRAQVILTGDTKQIGSVGAGSAFQQLQDAHPEATHSLTDIKRQSSAELRQAVYDSLDGRFSDALSKVDTREIRDRSAAVDAIADQYMRQTGAGKDTLVVTLSRDDREAVNSAIQQRREAAGQVRDVQVVQTLAARQWTEAERADAARYAVGGAIEAGRDFKRGPKRGELAAVTAVSDGEVTVRRANGEEWTFEPNRTKKFSVLEKGEQRIGAGDRIVAKGSIYARDATDLSKRIAVKNGTAMTVVGSKDGVMVAALDDDRRVAIDTHQGAKIALAYAETANQAQGRTVNNVVAYMRSGQTNLADRQHAYVAMSRAREHATVVTDDKAKLAATLERSTHGKETARPDREEAQAADGNALDEQRTLSARARSWAADCLARLQNGIEDARARAHEREQAWWAKQDRTWLRKGDKLRSKIERNSARTERDIAHAFGTGIDAGKLGRLFESRRQRQGREHIEQLRAGRNAALDKINASLDRAFGRAVAREAKESGVSADQARQRVAGRTLIDRHFRVEAAIARVGAWFAEAANGSRPTPKGPTSRMADHGREQADKAKPSRHRGMDMG